MKMSNVLTTKYGVSSVSIVVQIGVIEKSLCRRNVSRRLRKKVNFVSSEETRSWLLCSPSSLYRSCRLRSIIAVTDNFVDPVLTLCRNMQNPNYYFSFAFLQSLQKYLHTFKIDVWYLLIFYFASYDAYCCRYWWFFNFYNKKNK